MWAPIDDLDEVKSFIGVIFAVLGNILISLALNVQKLTHNEIEKRRLDKAYYRSQRDSVHPQDSGGYQVLLDPEELERNDYLYLHSKSWWLGMLLMVVGEIGNFIAYAFAPASVVAPLGTVALISNVILAPIMLHETFRKQDVLGITIAIVGAIIVVANSKTDEVKLTPEAIEAALLQTQFIVYFLITIITVSLLAYASNHWGRKIILIDLSLVAIFGGYTVLATKAISSLLTVAFVKMFEWSITYLMLFTLIITAVLQIKYLNTSLQRFDSTQVIPTQFVLFTVSAIIGSSVLYNDFANADSWQLTCFLAGCCLTFIGVYFITSNRDTPPQYVRRSRANSLRSRIPRVNSGIAFRPVFPVGVVYDAPNETDDSDDEYPFGERSAVTTIPRRHTLHEPSIDATTPLLNSRGSSRHDSLIRSLMQSGASSVGQALNSVGARHSLALGLDQVFENYRHRPVREQNDLENLSGRFDNQNSNFHRRSMSVPPAYTNNYPILGFQTFEPSSPVTSDREETDSHPKSFTNSSYLSTSYSNSSYYDSESVTDSAVQTDDDSRTTGSRSGFTTSNNSSIYLNDAGSEHYFDYHVHDLSDEEVSLPDIQLDNGGDLPDLPVRRENYEILVED